MSQIGFGPTEDPEDPEDYDDPARGEVTHHGSYDEGAYDDRDEDEEAPARRRRRFGGCLPVLVVLVILLAGAWFGGRYAYDQLSAKFADAPDYAGPGTGQVLYQVKAGATSTQIARELKSKGVVASVDAFTAAAAGNEKSRNIQVGYYELKQRMSASQALDVLVDPASLVQSLVTIPEGARVKSIVATIVGKTDLTRRAVTRALASPSAIGLPAAAKGNPEGYLFPATYTIPPRMTAVQLIQQMVAKTVETEKSLDIAAKAKKLGLTSQQVLTVASILEYEASRDSDYPKVARAIYNRLDQKMPLQSDATVAYANQSSGTIYTTEQERRLDSRYNTYRYAGLPPGPIGSPGEKTIEAALNPSSGRQLFWVVVNLRTGETLYAKDYSAHLRNVDKFRAYCQTSDAC